MVLPSQREGLSYALLEAMALGLPTVVSDAPGNPEAIGETGIVASRGDTAAFADAFRRLLEPDLRVGLGEQARKRALESFGAEETAKQTRAIYDRATAEARRSPG
jgi:glycosyltransferase involved in cell wall biosynthesis